MSDKTTLEIIKEMTEKIKKSMCNLTPITEKRYQYSKEECETIFNNVFNAVKQYTEKDPEKDAYEKLLISVSDRFKVSSTGGNVSRQVDALTNMEDLYNNQTKFQELLDNAKDLVIFIEDKTNKLPGANIVKTSNEKEVAPEETEQKPEENTK